MDDRREEEWNLTHGIYRAHKEKLLELVKEYGTQRYDAGFNNALCECYLYRYSQNKADKLLEDINNYMEDI